MFQPVEHHVEDVGLGGATSGKEEDSSTGIRLSHLVCIDKTNRRKLGCRIQVVLLVYLDGRVRPSHAMDLDRIEFHTAVIAQRGCDHEFSEGIFNKDR